MKRISTFLLPVIILIGLPSTTFAQSVTVNVDCTLGESINQALGTVADDLTININGICVEDVSILRSRVNLVGTDPLTDGIAPDGDTINRSLVIFGANTIGISNLRLIDGRFGLSINAAFGINVNNVYIEVEDFGFGVIAGSASGSINLSNTTVTSSGTGSRGIWVGNGGFLRCFGCLVEKFRTGALMSQGSEIFLDGTTIQTTRRALEVTGGSRVTTNFAGTANTFEGETVGGGFGTQGALRLTGTSSAILGADSLSGKVEVFEKSVAELYGTSVAGTLYFHWISSGSTVLAASPSGVVGNWTLDNFSNLTVQAGSTITGELTCNSGSDAYCDVAGAASGGSNCNSCPP